MKGTTPMMVNHPLSQRRLVAVEYNHEARQLHFRFDDESTGSVSVDQFKEFRAEAPERVTLDEYRYGVEFHYADGFVHDVAATFLTWLTNADYARAYPKGEDIGPAIGANVIRLRKARGMSQLELAKRADILAPNLSRLESGKHVPTLDVLLRIASAFGVHLAVLMEPEKPLKIARTGERKGSKAKRPSGSAAKSRARK